MLQYCDRRLRCHRVKPSACESDASLAEFSQITTPSSTFTAQFNPAGLERGRIVHHTYCIAGNHKGERARRPHDIAKSS